MNRTMTLVLISHDGSIPFISQMPISDRRMSITNGDPLSSEVVWSEVEYRCTTEFPIGCIEATYYG